MNKPETMQRIAATRPTAVQIEASGLADGIRTAMTEVGRLMELKINDPQWYRRSVCGDATSELFTQLSRLEFNCDQVHRQLVGPFFHRFVVVASAGVDYIVDPTWQQFIPEQTSQDRKHSAAALVLRSAEAHKVAQWTSTCWRDPDNPVIEALAGPIEDMESLVLEDCYRDTSKMDLLTASKIPH